MKALIVEGDWDIQHLLSIWLMEDGFETVSVADAQGALRLIGDKFIGAIDIVICDSMPSGMSVLDLCRQIRSMVPTIKIVVMGPFDDETHAAWLSSIVQGVVPKPFERAKLRQCLEEVLALGFR